MHGFNPFKKLTNMDLVHIKLSSASPTDEPRIIGANCADREEGVVLVEFINESGPVGPVLEVGKTGKPVRVLFKPRLEMASKGMRRASNVRSTLSPGRLNISGVISTELLVFGNTLGKSTQVPLNRASVADNAS